MVIVRYKTKLVFNKQHIFTLIESGEKWPKLPNIVSDPAGGINLLGLKIDDYGSFPQTMNDVQELLLWYL